MVEKTINGGIVIEGSESNDHITNDKSNVKISAFGGNDTVESHNVGGTYVDAGNGNDSVSNILDYSTITGASEYSGNTIIGGNGNDSISNIGGNNASIVSGVGNDNIFNRHGYYSTINAGEGDDIINISNGHYQYIDSGVGNDTIKAEINSNSGDWAMGGYASLIAGEGNDLITPIYSNNSYIDGGNGNDTIVTNGKDSTITGGVGNNLISLTSAESDEAEALMIVANEGENTTVYGFKTTDTLTFADGVTNKAVELNEKGLSFWTDTVMGGSEYLKITFPDITESTVLNTKYGTDDLIVEAFIGDGDIYNVTAGAADIYVGAVATHNQGISFEGVTKAVNIALDTETDGNEYWNLHSVIGGDGNTTIKGSDLDDTIKAGKGATTIIGSVGNDVLIGNEQTTFIINGEKLNISDSEVSVKTFDDKYIVYDTSRINAENAKDKLLKHNKNAKVYDENEIDSILSSATDITFWDGDMYHELPTSIESGKYLEVDHSTNTGRKVTYINNQMKTVLKFNDEGKNIAIIGNEIESQVSVIAGAGGDTLTNYSTKAKVTMTGGTGADYIVASGGENEIIDLSNGGKDTITAVNGASIKGYDVNTGLIFQTDTPTKDDIIEAVMTGTIYLGSDYFGPSSDNRVKLIDYDFSKGTFARLKTVDGDVQLYGWSPQHGGNAIGDEYAERQILFGVAPSGKSTLKGGRMNDLIYAGCGDTVILSKGFDTIRMDHRNPQFGNALIDLVESDRGSRATVEEFNYESDIIKVSSLNDVRIKVETDKIDLTENNKKLTINTDKMQITDGNETYTIHTDFEDMETAYAIEKEDGTILTADKGLSKKNNEYSYVEGKQTITGFNFGTGESSNVINIDLEVEDIVNKMTIEGKDLKIEIDEENQLEIKGARNKEIGYSYRNQSGVMKIGKQLTYSEEVDFYTNDKATSLKVESDYSGEEVEILMNGSDGKTYNNIKEINASKYEGASKLAGNEQNNIIRGSKGNSSLWGGTGDDVDMLIGASGYDEFFYLKGNGKDMIRNVESTDLINLMDISMDDISSTNESTSYLNINFKDGGRLIIEAKNDLQFKLSDGSQMEYNQTKKEWRTK